MSKSKTNQFAAIELGTQSIKVLIAEDNRDSNVLDIIGEGTTDSLKIVKGEIHNLDMVAEKLEYAVQMAEEMAHVDIRDAYTSLVVSGNYISQTSLAIDVMTESPDKTISQEDVNRAIRNARAKDISPKNEVLSTSVRFHTLADGRQVLDPIGLIADSMQTSIQLIQARRQNLATPVKLVNELLERELNVICYAPMVLGKACLSPDDVKNNGHVCIDIGAGVTSCALFTNAGCHTAFQITVGTEQAANDLAIALQLPIQYTRNFICGMGSLEDNFIAPGHRCNGILTFEQGPGMPRLIYKAETIAQVLALRFSEIFEIIRDRLKGEDAWRFAETPIFLSGGAVRIPGIIELAQSVFQESVVTAKPVAFSGPPGILADPRHIALFGALRNAKESLDLFNYKNQDDDNDAPSAVGKITSVIKTIFNI